jgi:light-regulated signal transduction histidine kinase (bacteriophytochrome)
MTSDLQSARIAELERQVAALTEQVATARRELEALSYAVSHDLRAPLRSLSGFSQALAELPNDTLDPKAAHFLDRIQQASRKLSTLIDALINLSRIARADMQPRALDFTQLCTEVAASVSARYPDRVVQLDIAPGMTAFGDSRMLRTAMENLLDNAWKSVAHRSHATVSVAQEGDTYVVRDNGLGFDMTYAEKLFRPFQRMHADMQFPGIGVGLAAVQRIVARHGGRVWADAKPDHGAAFNFTLSAQAQR